MNVFISQPMRGKTDDEIMAARGKAIDEVTALYADKGPVEILDSWFSDFDGNAVQFLGRSISLLGEADLAVFLPGWNKARGCRIEELVANTYDIECLYPSD